MKKRILITIPLISLALFGLFAAPAAAENLCSIDSVVVLGTNSVQIGRDSDVTGDLVANDASAGPVLDEGVELAVDSGCGVTGNVSGDSVDLDKNSSVSGDVSYNDLSKHNSVVIGGDEISPLDLPVFAELPEFETASPSSFDLAVGAGMTVVVGDVGGSNPLARRDFGDITIDKGGVLVFSGGGDFDVRSISAVSTVGGPCPAPCRSIHFDSATDLRVADKFDSERDAFVGPGLGSGISAADIVIYVGGINGATGGLLESPAAAEVGRDSTVEANIYAPGGSIVLGQGTDATGSYLARDVNVKKNSTVTLESAFSNGAPIAIAQEVQTDGANALVITLEGSDPEGGDLMFSIEVDPTEGTLGVVSPITPAAVNQCSQSGEACDIDSDCPFFVGGETCDSVTPPISQATVTYTSTAANCATDPESGEVECPADFFTFGVTDECGVLGTAIVSINGGTDETPDDPEPGVDTVEANDLEIDTIVNQVVAITLTAAAPGTVASLTFRVETLPTGALQDSDGFPVVAGVDLPSPVLTYQAPGTGSDSFTFSARDSATTIPPACGPPSCDTGAVNIDIDLPPELAPSQSVSSNLNTPVEITLFINEGGTGDGGAPAMVGGSALELTSGNGPPLTREQRSRLAARRPRVDSDARGALIGGGTASLTAVGVGAGWGAGVGQFGWCEQETASRCSVTTTQVCTVDADCPATETCNFCSVLVPLESEVEVIESPFDFTTTEASCLRITDTLAKGDHWRVEASFGSNPDWTDFTSEVDQSTVGTTSDPDVAFGDLSYSHGGFDLVGSGSYSVRLFTIPPDSFAFGTAGYIRVDAGPCVDIIWTITALPLVGEGTLTNLDGSPVLVGATYNTTPTVVFTPAFMFDGPSSFTYEVAQGSTLGQNVVVDTAIVDLLIAATDTCIINGRPFGCVPGLSGGQVSEPAQSAPIADRAPAGPGVAVRIEGEGDVTSSRPVINGVTYRGVICSAGAAACRGNFADGSEVTLYARSHAGRSKFVEWRGDCSGSNPIIVVTARRGTSCTAVFELVDQE